MLISNIFVKMNLNRLFLNAPKQTCFTYYRYLFICNYQENIILHIRKKLLKLKSKINIFNKFNFLKY